jgi:multicomponent Na+:H+ antiporter subunit B
MKPSVILIYIARTLVPVFLIISLQILWRGHNLPGGGFIGGLIAGSVLSLAGWIFGLKRAREMLIVSPISLIFAGLGIALTSGIMGYFLGSSIFEGLWISVPWLGKLGSPLLFDVGVYVVVVGFCIVFSWELLESGKDNV